jgi:putative acetyltransferase
MTQKLIVGVESPLQTDIDALLRQSDDVAARLYPGEYRRREVAPVAWTVRRLG